MAQDAGIIRQQGSIRYLDRSLKGAPGGILFFFLLNPGLACSEPDLLFYTGYSRPTLRGALGTLARFGAVAQLGDRPVWALTAHLRQLDFSEVAKDAGTLASTAGEAQDAGALGGGEKNFFPVASSSSYLDPDQDETTTSTGGGKNFSPQAAAEPDPAVLDALQGAGIFADLAQELARDPWVTEARIAAWLARLQADRTVRSVAAVLATSLKRHLEPGPAPRAKKRAAESIYLCAECHAAPCLCNDDKGVT